METPIFIMMIGIAGSGKSTIANQVGFDVVSTDSIRKELFGSENDQQNPSKVFEIALNRVRNFIKNGKSVVFDATNLSSKRRKNFLKCLPECKKVAYLVATDYDVIIKQNESRERVVPRDVIDRMYVNLNMPSKLEGFDDIIIFKNKEWCPQIIDVLYPTMGYEQNNPHHEHQLYEHMNLAAKYVVDHFKDKYAKDDFYILYTAAMLHDVGKPAVRTDIKSNGTVDGYSHYYNHHNVGAYMLACISKYTDEWKKIILLTQFHMEFFLRKDSIDSFERDVKTYYGEHFWNMLVDLHEADLNAH